MRIVTLECGARKVVRIGLEAGSFFLLRLPYLGEGPWDSFPGGSLAFFEGLRDSGADLASIPGLEEVLSRAGAIYAAEKDALAALARREHSRAELVKKLGKKEHGSSMVRPALDRLEEEGLLSDERFAEYHVRSRLRSHPQGEAALRLSLRMKGVSKDIAKKEILEERPAILEGLDGLARKLSSSEGEKIRKKGLSGKDAKFALKAALYRKLLSRGYSSSDIRSILIRISGEELNLDEPDEST